MMLGASAGFWHGDLGAAIALAFTYFTIIYVTGLGGLYSERSGIVNIGLEGMMIIGTVTGSWGTFYFTTELGWGLPWGPIMGLLIGMVAGALFASIHALATVTFKVDQIVSGVVINLVAIGLARFLSTVFFGQATQSDSGQPHLNPIDIPGLSSLPLGLGKAFTGLSPVVIVATAWISANRPPARNPTNRPMSGPQGWPQPRSLVKKAVPQEPVTVPMIIMPSRPMFTMPDRSL